MNINLKMAYAIIRFAQRVSLAWTFFATILYWVLVIAIATVTGTVYDIKDVHFSDTTHQVAIMHAAIDKAAHTALNALIVSALLTVALAIFSKVRKSEKRLLLDSAAIILFCFWALLFGQPIIRHFVQHLG